MSGEAENREREIRPEAAGEWELPSTVHDLSVPAGGDRAYAACLDGGIYALGLGDGSVELLHRHGSYASGVHLHPDQGLLLSAGYDGLLRWYELPTAEVVREVRAHDFWSWQSALSPDGGLFASVTGRYECGGYRYEPAPEREPSVRVYEVATGRLRWSFEHVPPVESVAFSRDGTRLAAANLMGEVRMWDLVSGEKVAEWSTPDFTGWGIIKGHYYTGGVFGLTFGPGDRSLYLTGMGTTRDPAAGNGRQLWQEYALEGEGEEAVRMTGQADEDETGTGLMESLAFHPSDEWFVMAGRLEAGNWNAAAFGREDGKLRFSLNTQSRLTRAVFSEGGKALFLAGGVSQDGPDGEGGFRPYGRLGRWRWEGA